MFATNDPVMSIIRQRTKPSLKEGWAMPILAGNIISGCNKPMMIWGNGQIPETMASAAIQHSPAFQKLISQPLKLATGLELSEEEASLALADPQNSAGRLRGFGMTIRASDETEVKGLAEMVVEGLELIKGSPTIDQIPLAKLKPFAEKSATQLEGSLRRFNHLLVADDPITLLNDLQALESLFAKQGSKTTREALLATLPQAEQAITGRVTDRAKQIRETFEPVANAFTGALAYCLNSGFAGEFGICHIPKSMSPAKAAAFMVEEMIERKARCYDVVLLDPIQDASVLTNHWSPYFNGQELVQATVFASLDYKSLDELAEKARNTQTQSGSAAAHFVVTAGFGKVLGRRCAIGPAVAGGRAKRDGLLAPNFRHFGVLESSFGAQDDKAIFGYEDIDTLALRDGVRDRYALNGINTPAITDDMVHLFRANSLSSDLQFSQYDTTRAANWFIGTMRKFMRKVTIAQCNDSTLKSMVATEVTQLLNSPFAGKADFEVTVAPGKSSDPREFLITLSLPELAFVETIKIFVELKDPKVGK